MQSAIDIGFHDVCLIFPEMSQDELADLADDIKENGLQEAIWTHDGKVIDGRNRLKACQIAGVEPTFREWKGKGSLIAFALTHNMKRRHLTASQRAEIGVEVKRLLEIEIAEEKRTKCSESGKNGGRGNQKGFGTIAKTLSKPRNARKEAAKVVGAGERYIADAEKIAEKSPELAAEVKNGTKSIPQAKRELGLTPPKPVGKCKVNGQLVDDPPDIAKQRAAGKIPPTAVPEIDDPEDKTDLADVVEEYEERAAMAQDALSDADWLATLPARKSLSGVPLATFDEDALLFRRVAEFRKTFGRQFAGACKGLKRKGVYHRKVTSFLATNDPSKWLVCTSLENGGCGGKGTVALGDCPECRTKGYRINR